MARCVSPSRASACAAKDIADTIAAARVLTGVSAAVVRVQIEDVEIVVHDPAQVPPEWLAALQR